MNCATLYTTLYAILSKMDSKLCKNYILSIVWKNQKIFINIDFCDILAEFLLSCFRNRYFTRGLYCLNSLGSAGSKIYEKKKDA